MIKYYDIIDLSPPEDLNLENATFIIIILDGLQEQASNADGRCVQNLIRAKTCGSDQVAFTRCCHGVGNNFYLQSLELS